jgi:Cys-tRNA(Pro) deacylase
VARQEIPVTPAVRVLRAKGISFQPRLYSWEEHGGTALSARALGVPERCVIKTLVLRTDAGECLLLLMHGDREASLKQLARTLGVRHVEMADEEEAHRRTGYLFGGTSPFGTRTPIPVYVERTVFELPRILINGGKRGFLVEIDPSDLRKALHVAEVDVASPG